VLAVWAAAALPMGVLTWVVAPAIAGHGASERRFALTLLGALTFGLVWQAAVVLGLVLRERRDPTWTSVRDRLWRRAPTATTRRGGRLWWWVPVYALALAALDLLPFGPTGPTDRNFGLFLGSPEGQQTFHHAWGLYALVAVELMFTPSSARSCCSAAYCCQGCAGHSAGPTGSSTVCCSVSTICTSHG
jgi:hypothetical protein